MVEELQIKRHWYKIKAQLKKKYGQLIEDDLIFHEGREEELLKRLEKRTGRTEDELRAEILQMEDL